MEEKRIQYIQKIEELEKKKLDELQKKNDENQKEKSNLIY